VPYIQQANQQYNDFVITKNQNLIQGQFHRVGLTEIRFPWAIPNVNARNNTLYAQVAPNAPVLVTVPEGFYTGTELAAALQGLLRTATGSATLTVVYTTASGAFIISDSAATPLALYPALPPITTANQNTESLLQIIGMDPQQMPLVSTNLSTQPLRGATASLLYTDYVDIVSFQLTNNQKVKDMTTQTSVPRNAVICRLFLNNEISTEQYGADAPSDILGTRPFLIHRQFDTPKMIRWENDRSVGQVDIALYDMRGNPLYVPTVPIYFPVPATLPAPLPDYQLTFLASED
jgi:hypothetical protein